jgi:hypothetical protein
MTSCTLPYSSSLLLSSRLCASAATTHSYIVIRNCFEQKQKQKLTAGNHPTRSFLASSPAETHDHRSVQCKDLCVFFNYIVAKRTCITEKTCHVITIQPVHWSTLHEHTANACHVTAIYCCVTSPWTPKIQLPLLLRVGLRVFKRQENRSVSMSIYIQHCCTTTEVVQDCPNIGNNKHYQYICGSLTRNGGILRHCL